MNLVILLEEESAKRFLDALLPRFLPKGVVLTTIPHRGKSDLRKSIPKKLAGWRLPDSHFVILHDQDGHVDCVALKDELKDVCSKAGRPDTCIRIVCRELEAWYLGDPAAVDAVFGGTRCADMVRKKPYRKCDSVVTPSRHLKNAIPEFQKVSSAADIGRELDHERCASPSFRVFFDAILQLCGKQLIE